MFFHVQKLKLNVLGGKTQKLEIRIKMSSFVSINDSREIMYLTTSITTCRYLLETLTVAEKWRSDKNAYDLECCGKKSFTIEKEIEHSKYASFLHKMHIHITRVRVAPVLLHFHFNIEGEIVLTRGFQKHIIPSPCIYGIDRACHLHFLVLIFFVFVPGVRFFLGKFGVHGDPKHVGGSQCGL